MRTLIMDARVKPAHDGGGQGCRETSALRLCLAALVAIAFAFNGPAFAEQKKMTYDQCMKSAKPGTTPSQRAKWCTAHGYN
jgi:hypothetical protein